MKIALIGPGAMGLLFGGYLSKENDVTLIGSNPDNMKLIEENGISIHESDGSVTLCHPHATADASSLSPVDLVLLFVKASVSESALKKNQNLIGPDTILMTLQNGAGHEKILSRFADEEHILLGTTQQGSGRITPNSVNHSGLGSTSIGAIVGSSARFAPVCATFEACGFPCSISDQVKGMIWNKLMINASSSVLSGVLQMPQGYVVKNSYAWEIAQNLIREICAVATADGYPFDAEEQIERLNTHLNNAPDGLPSIMVDLKNGRKTEASVITGAVVDAAHRLNISVPVNEMVLLLVHAMEGRS